jgi:hypothetical protein
MIPRDIQFDLRSVAFTPELLASIPVEVVRRYRVLPVFCSFKDLHLALADPSDFEAIGAVQATVQREVGLCLVEPNQLEEFIACLYGPEGTREG